MTDREKISLGRKYAIGDNRSIDYVKAYELWKDVRFKLNKDDSELFDVIESIVYDMYADENPHMSLRAVNFSQAEEKKVTEADVRELFERLMKDIPIEKIYKALAKLDEPKVAVRVRKPENIRLGNNIAFLIYQFRWNSAYFCEQLNKFSEDRGVKGRTRQAMSQIIGGVNGMSDSGKMLLADFLNEMDVKHIMVRKITVSDLSLPLSEISLVFKEPRFDERLKSLMSA